jgi:hypothetical protein
MHARLLIACLTSTLLSFAAERVTLTGKITDNLGKPLDDAIVMIYHAGVKKGYNTFCPSCYVDWGKRTVTDRAGAFTITGLDPDLWFELLVVRDGYAPAFVKKVDPSQGPAGTASLAPRTPVDEPARVARGIVVDSHGQPVRAAVVEPIGVGFEGGRSSYGALAGLEPVAVTNVKGEFELAYRSKVTGMMVQIEARGMAPKIISIPTGADRTRITVADGAVIRGRLLNGGKPVPGAEVGLIAKERGRYGGALRIFGNPYPEIRIGTQPDGTFVIPNVPANVDWYVYGKMESIASLGAADPVECKTSGDGDDVNAGDIRIHPGHRLRGQVSLSDGAPIANNMRISIETDRIWDTQTVLIGRDGRFEFTGLPAGNYKLWTSVRGYQMLGHQREVELAVDWDLDDFAVRLEPTSQR